MNNIKIVRLQSGEDIIADYEEREGEGFVFLTNPMTLIFKRLPTGKAVMLMSPWLPIELVEQNNTLLYSQDILAVMQPKQSLIGYYGKTIKDLELDMLQHTQEIEDSLEDYDSQQELDFFEDGAEEDYDEEATEEEVEEMNQLRMDIKKRLLH
jgi:hypothetical protein